MCVAVLLGDDGYCDDDWPDAKGDEVGCHPTTLRISAEVWRRDKLVGGDDALASGWGGGAGAGAGGGAWALSELGEGCPVPVPPIEPYPLRAERDKCDGIGGRWKFWRGGTPRNDERRGSSWGTWRGDGGLSNVKFEKYGRLLEVGGSFTSSMPLMVPSCRWISSCIVATVVCQQSRQWLGSYRIHTIAM